MFQSFNVWDTPKDDPYSHHVATLGYNLPPMMTIIASATTRIVKSAVENGDEQNALRQDAGSHEVTIVCPFPLSSFSGNAMTSIIRSRQ